MYDPSTVAFDINIPLLGKNNFTKRQNYYTLITIWHQDPERTKEGYCRTRGDDTCGWFNPPRLKKDDEALRKISIDQYRNICAKQVAHAEKKDYWEVCNDPTVVDAVYWCWRAVKHYYKPRGILWQYGADLTFAEWQAIFMLATNPVDNVRFTFTQIHNAETFEELFMCVVRAVERFYRPWYKHPRWHIHHWRIVFHPWRQFYRRYFEKCCVCEKRGFPKGCGAMSDWEGTRVWHSTCDPNIQAINAKMAEGATASVTLGVASADLLDAPTPNAESSGEVH